MISASASALDAYEAELASALKNHPVFRLEENHTDAILKVLVQRRFLSLEFTKVYDMLLAVVDDEDAKGTIRQIIRDEYPADGKSHREDLVDDIRKICGSGDFLREGRSQATRKSLAELDEYVDTIIRCAHPSMAAIAFLRFWGEVLTGVEYEMYWYKWLCHKLSKDHKGNLPLSRFYWYHFEHDHKAVQFAQRIEMGFTDKPTHADELGSYLVGAFSDPVLFDLVKEIESRAGAMKIGFYDQFV